jgi:hypothetical protein
VASATVAQRVGPLLGADSAATPTSGISKASRAETRTVAARGAIAKGLPRRA